MTRATGKAITPADQPRLSLGRTVRIAIDGVRYRLFRAAVTVSVIAVAVAFLMNILSESLIMRRLASSAREELRERREVHRWAARLTRPSQPEAILAAMGDAAAADDVLTWLDPEPDAVATFRTRARTAAAYLAFFDGLDYDRRRMLIHTARGTGIFEALQDGKRFAQFQSRLADMPAVRFISPLPDFAIFLELWPALARHLQDIAAAEQSAIERLDEVRGSRSVFEALAEEHGTFAATAREAGFPLDPDTARRLAEQARTVLDRRTLARSLSLLEARQLLAQHFDLLPADVSRNELWHFLNHPKRAEQYLAVITPLDPIVAHFTPAQLLAFAGQRRRELDLERTEHLTTGAGGGWLGLGDRMGWLLIVSMLVCAIGISNAMLMTVTERFREIATMKCLGALDGFIMLLFVVESCFLGLVGGIIGALLGNLIGFGRMAARFDLGVFTSAPLTEAVVAMAAAVAVGVVLAAVAAIYPSLKAARLAPMEAMRVE